MKAKRYLKTIALALFGWAIAAPLGAEVFTQTYEVNRCEDYDYLADLLVGSGTSLYGVDGRFGKKVDNANTYQIGVYSNLVADALLSFTNGVILSTGYISDGSLSNTSVKYSWNNEAVNSSVSDDSDLHNCFGQTVADPAGIILYFRPQNKTINLPYMVASEHFFYQGSNPPQYSKPKLSSYTAYDKFAFFLKEIGDANGTIVDDGASMAEFNVAKFPDGGYIGIDTVNQHTNTEYFVANVSNENDNLVFPANDIALPMEFNGAIVGPKIVVKGLDNKKVYKLKIVVADCYNNVINTAIFLPEHGITSGADLKLEMTGTESLVPPGKIVFTNTVANIGPVAADGVVVTNYLPLGLSDFEYDVQVGGVTSCQVGGTNCYVWAIGDGFAPESNAVMTVTCKNIGGAISGSFTNLAVVATETGDYDGSNDSAKCVTDVGELPLLTITAISMNGDAAKTYGENIDKAALDFVTEISVSDGSEAPSLTGIEVSFTNHNGEVAYPTNATAAAGLYGICLANATVANPDSYRGIEYVSGELEVKKASLAIIADDAKKAYGEVLNPVGFSCGALQNGEQVDTVAIACSEATEATTSAGYYEDKVLAGFPVVGSSGFDTNNYDISFTPGSLTVTQAVLTVTAHDTNKVYGAVLQLDQSAYDIDGLVNGDSASVTLKCDDGTPAGAASGDYDIVPVVGSMPNYQVVTKNGKLTVGKQAITIVARNQSKPYGQKYNFNGKNPVQRKLVTVVPGLQAGHSIDSVTFESEGADATAKCSDEGYELRVKDAQGTGLENYIISYQSAKMFVTQREITVKAKDFSKTYGDVAVYPNPSFEVIGTMYNGDQVADAVVSSDGAAAEKPCAKYPVTVGSASGNGLDNYVISYADGELTVNKRQITITAGNDSKTYGDGKALDWTNFVKPIPGLMSWDSVTKVMLGSEGVYPTAKWCSEGYPIVATGVAEGSGMENYEISFVPGVLTVNKRQITITPSEQHKPYGTRLNFKGTEFDPVENLANDDRVTSLRLMSDGAKAAAKCLTGKSPDYYEINCYMAGGFGLENYQITYATGKLYVTERDLTITANDATKRYGDTLPETRVGTEFTVTAGTVESWDGIESVKFTYDAGRTATAPVIPESIEGYQIVPSAASGTGLENYKITYANGRLTVTPYPITITADSTNKTYGASVEFSGREFTVAPTQLPNGEKIDKVAISSVEATSADTAVGTYPDAVVAGHAVTGIGSTFSTNNYAISFLPGDLTVGQAELTIEVKDVRWNVIASPNERPQYGFEDFTSQLKCGDCIADIVGGSGAYTDVTYTNRVSDSFDPRTLTDAYTYYDEIWIDLRSVDGGSVSNYAITIVPGNLTVTPGDPKMEVTMNAKLNFVTGLFDITLTVTNNGDGSVKPDSDYWVELLPGPVVTTGTSGLQLVSYYLYTQNAMPSGHGYVVITDRVKSALTQVGNRDAVFNPGETVTLTKVANVYHYACVNPKRYIDPNEFFVYGYLFNSQDANRDFRISAAEKASASGLLGQDSAAYLEVTRLAELPYYRWSVEDFNWK